MMSKDKELALIEDYKNGLNLFALRKKYHISHSSVRTIIEKYNLDIILSVVSVKKDYKDIIDMYITGVKIADICRKYSCSRPTIYDLLADHNISLRGKRYFCGKDKYCHSCERLKPATEEFWYKNERGTDELNSECIECMRKRSTAWAKNNKDKVNKINRNRKALAYSLKEDYSLEDVLYTKNLFDNKCFRCSSTTNLNIDHHYPLSKGFVLTRENAVLLCQSCNAKKGIKLPQFFYSMEEIQRLKKLGIVFYD